jgi:hypothetical protein
MRTRLVALLILLAVPLMGSECHVAARVGGPPPPPPDGVDPPPPGGGGGGGVIIVTSTNPVAAVSTLDTRPLERNLVASALAASVWTPPERKPVARSAVHPGSTIQVPISRSFDLVPAAQAGGVAALAVPEPTGALLFACGFLVASLRARARTGDPLLARSCGVFEDVDLESAFGKSPSQIVEPFQTSTE